MKKILLVLLAIYVVFSFTACDTNEGTPQSGNAGDGDVTNVSTGSDVKLNNVIDDGSLTVVVKEDSFEVTLTHPKISLEFLENDGHVGASFDMADDVELIYLYADIHASNDSYFTSNLHDFQNGKRHDAKYIIEDGSITWIDLSVPYDITQAETIYMTVGTTALDYEHYYAYYAMEDVVTFDE